MPRSSAPPPTVAQRRYAIPITCSIDGLAHDVTDEDAAVGARTGTYQALCGHLVVAAAMAAPVGRPCARCTAVSRCRAVSVAARPAPGPGPGGRARHRRPGWLWRMLHPGTDARGLA